MSNEHEHHTHEQQQHVHAAHTDEGGAAEPGGQVFYESPTIPGAGTFTPSPEQLGSTVATEPLWNRRLRAWVAALAIVAAFGAGFLTRGATASCEDVNLAVGKMGLVAAKADTGDSTLAVLSIMGDFLDEAKDLVEEINDCPYI